MIRTSVFTAALAGLLASTSRADVEVAPPPREVRADGSRDIAPAPEVAPQENPSITVDRIIKNSKAVGDKLATIDTGEETRSTQARILKDIESLIDMQNDSSSKSGGDSSDKNKNRKSNDKNQDQKNDGKSPSDGMKQPPKDGNQPKGGMGPKDDQNQQATSGHRPRKGSRDRKPPGKDKDMGMANNTPMNQKPEPGPGNSNGAKDKDQKAGAVAGNPMGPADPRPSLPITEEVVKEVWGHLPDKLRQQVTQYYREQFMPKYADLLRQYYSSLANSPPQMP